MGHRRSLGHFVTLFGLFFRIAGGLFDFAIEYVVGALILEIEHPSFVFSFLGPQRGISLL
jgi:hypothetical protein